MDERAQRHSVAVKHQFVRRLSRDRFARAVIHRLAYRTHINILSAPANDSELPHSDGYSLARIGPDAFAADRELAEQTMQQAGEPAGLVNARLAHGDELFGWQTAGRIASFGWVSYRDRSVGPLRLADLPGRAFLYNFFTLAQHRGRGLYPTLLLAIRSALGREGATEFLIDVDVRNAPSAKGVSKAGFVPTARIAYLTVLTRWRWLLERTVSSDRVSQVFRW